MDSTLRRSAAWALIVAAAVGIILAVATLPTVWAVVSGRAWLGWTLEIWLPRWSQWHRLSLTGVHLVVGALLCGMLLVAGRRATRLIALASLVWFVGATVAVANGSYWASWMALKGDGTPMAYQITGHGLALVALSVAAILTARDGLKRTRSVRQTVDHDAGSGSG